MEPKLSNDEVLQQFLKLLEDNKGGQVQDLNMLLQYMDTMTQQFNAVSQELQEIKQQLAQEKRPEVKHEMQSVISNLEQKVKQGLELLNSLQEKIVQCAASAVKGFREIGVTALDHALSALNVKNTLDSLQSHINTMITDVSQNIERMENIGIELRSAGEHLRNAGRAAAGKEAQAVDSGKEGRFQAVILAPMRTIQKLLTKMRDVSISVGKNLDNLGKTAQSIRETRTDRSAKRKPSILKSLIEKRATARAAPVPKKSERKTETVL